MDSDNESSLKNLKTVKENFDDFCRESAGLNTGKIPRFCIENHHHFQLQKEENRKLSVLELLLLNVQYQKAYNRAMDAFYAAKDAVAEALFKARADFKEVKNSHENLLARADTMIDGTKVFVGEDNEIYTEHGKRLSEAQKHLVEHREGSPTWEQFKQSELNIKQRQFRFEKLMGYQSRLNEIGEQLHDNDKAFELEGLGDVTDELHSIRDESTNIEVLKEDFSAKAQNKNLAPLNLSF